MLQVSVEDCPFSIVDGLADKVTVGAAGAGGGGGGGVGAIGAFFLQPPAKASISKQKTSKIWRSRDFRMFIILLLQWFVGCVRIGLQKPMRPAVVYSITPRSQTKKITSRRN